MWPTHFTRLEAAPVSRASLTNLIAADLNQDPCLRALICSGRGNGPMITKQKQLILSARPELLLTSISLGWVRCATLYACSMSTAS